MSTTALKLHWSRIHRRFFTLWVMTIALLAPSFSASHTGYLGVSSVAPVLTTLQQERMARQFIKIVASQKFILEDSQINNYITSLTRKLAASVQGYTDNYQIFVINDPVVNAFAGPGGVFFLHTGLLGLAKNEGELASVIAHEIAHHSQNHLAQLYEKQKLSQIPTMIAIVAGVAAGGDDALAITAAATAAQTEMMIDYTNHFEREADVIGLQILTDSGYDPRDLSNFLVSLETWLRHSGARQRTIHNTHPVTPDRIAYVKARINRFPQKTRQPDSTDFLMTQARIEALYNFKTQKTSEKFRELIQNNEGNHANYQYGYALALMKDRQYDLARQQINQLISMQPDSPRFKFAAAEIELSAGNPENVPSILSNLDKSYSENITFVELTTKALLRMNQATEAQKFVRKRIIKNPEFPDLHKLHAQAANAANDNLNSHLSLSEYYFLRGDLKLALRQLKLAEQFTKNDFYITETIRGKIEIVEQELKWRS